MAIFGNFKGTTQSEFKIGKNTGNKISTGVLPDANVSLPGDLYIDSGNVGLKIYTGNAWTSVGSTTETLNVDSGTLFVNNETDTVSIGSTSSNEKLFVNGSIRLGTNPAVKYSGAYLDLQHSNGTGTVIRVRDNNTNTDPVFKVSKANNSSDAFKVQGEAVTINNSYTLPSSDGTTGQVVITDGNGSLTFTTLSLTAAGSNTQVQFNNNGNLSSSASFTFDDATNTLQTGVVRGIVFELITDYGNISEQSDVNIDFGTITDTNSASSDYEFLVEVSGIIHDGYSVNALPNATQPGQMIYVEDESGGATMAFSDGTNWRRITDRNIVS